MTDPRPFIREDLEGERCTVSGCRCGGSPDGPVLIRPRCHSNAGLAASYDSEDGVLHLLCMKCSGPVARISVSAGAYH